MFSQKLGRDCQLLEPNLVFGTFKGMEIFWKWGWGRADTGQLHIKALFCCGTSVSVLLLDSSDSAHSQCWERDFFPMDDRQISQRASKGQSTHTEQIQTGIMKMQRQTNPSSSYFTSLQETLACRCDEFMQWPCWRFDLAALIQPVPASHRGCLDLAVLHLADWRAVFGEVLGPWQDVQ